MSVLIEAIKSKRDLYARKLLNFLHIFDLLEFLYKAKFSSKQPFDSLFRYIVSLNKIGNKIGICFIKKLFNFKYISS